MSKLKHWLDESSEADDFERAILRSGLDAGPPETAEDAVWTGLEQKLGLLPFGHPSTAAQMHSQLAAARKAATVSVSVGKGFLFGLALYAAGSGATALVTKLVTEPDAPKTARAALTKRDRRSPIAAEFPGPPPLASESRGVSREARPEPASTAPSPSNAASNLASHPSNSGSGGGLSAQPNSGIESLSAPSVAFARPASREPDAAAERRSTQLEAEARALREARAELRAGHVQQAWAALESSRRRFSVAELEQEREALSIEVLRQSGQLSLARDRAQAFLRRYPESPHAEQVRRAAGAD